MEEINTRKGQFVSAVGIGLNFTLAALKIVFGAVMGLVSVMADGFNNLSDCGSGVVSFVSFRISSKPADKEHPYGHQRAEYIASMLIGFFVLMLAVELLRESIEKAVAGEIVVALWWMYLILGISVAVKAGMFLFYRIAAGRLRSDALKAAATDSACDCLATSAVIIGLIISRFAGFAADGYAGILVALFIVWEGVGIVREASSKLLGQAPDEMLSKKLRELCTGAEGVFGIHDLRIYRFGPNKFFATVHLEMDASLTPLSLHETVDGLERRVREELGVELTAHLDPIDLQDEEATLLEERVRAATEGLVEGLNLHDFRLVRGAKNKIIFEAGVPFDCKRTDAEIAGDLTGAVKQLCGLEAVVSVERE